MRTEQQTKITEKKYYNALVILRNEIDSETLDSMSMWVEREELGQRTPQSLKRLGVVVKSGGLRFPIYVWNEKIPVTLTLVRKIMAKNNEINNSWRKPQVGMKKTVQPRKKTVQPREITVQPREQQRVIVRESHPYQKKVGLIRQFLRWIY